MATIETADAIALTERAADKVRDLMAQEPAGEAEVLRVAIQGGGCGGFEYALGFDRGATGDDAEYEFHGVR
ncbi:MAG TPA: iron-sulfur cluster assembly accessory protein, partial [Actinomycetota bacterium]|nr:iron-sulfur cluster assembly accessory protein [Actinomycetota bacterium]